MLFVRTVVIEVERLEAHDVSVASDDGARLQAQANAVARVAAFDAFPVQTVIVEDLLPGEREYSPKAS